MKTEFINDNIQNRKKLFYRLGGVLLLLILSYFLQYYFAPEGYKSGDYPARRWLTHGEFIGFSVLTALVIIPVIISSRIIQRLEIDQEANELKVDYIDRFRLAPVSKTVKLSETQVQIEETEYKARYSTVPEVFYTLHLTHSDFGHLKISGQDFKNISGVCREFQQLKDNAAAITRQSRRTGRGRRR